MEKSLSGSIDLIGLKKVGKGALIAGVGAALTFAVEALPNVNFGKWTPVVVGVFSILANFVRKWVVSYK